MVFPRDLAAHLAKRVSARLSPLQQQWRVLRRAVADLENQTVLALERLGVQPPPNDVTEAVVDVGQKPSLLKALAVQSARGVALVVSFLVLGFALLSLGMFVGAAALAFLLITRGLGLRVDVARPVPA